MKIENQATALRLRLDQLLPQTSAAVKQAVVDVRANAKTWRQAARDNGVTESGILRAMQRAKQASK